MSLFSDSPLLCDFQSIFKAFFNLGLARYHNSCLDAWLVGCLSVPLLVVWSFSRLVVWSFGWSAGRSVGWSVAPRLL